MMRAFTSAALFLLAGCAAFRSMQTDAFIDADGNVLVAEYGESSRPYKFKIRSPMNGAELECTDNKLVRLRLPEPSGERLTLRICQNDSPKGTMYSTKDAKWKLLTIGLACRLYLWYPQEKEYILVFEGDLSGIDPEALEESR